MTAPNPPLASFEPYVLDLVSGDDSKILSVSLYSGHAEITRSFKVHVKTGLNQLHIKGLPNAMQEDSLRYACDLAYLFTAINDCAWAYQSGRAWLGYNP